MNEGENFLTIEDLSSSIDQKVKRIQKGDLQIEKLEVLLDEVKDLQERLIILKYKTMEKLVKPAVEKKPSAIEKKAAVPYEGNTLQLDFGLERKSDVSENQISLIDSIAEISVEKKAEVAKAVEKKSEPIDVEKAPEIPVKTPEPIAPKVTAEGPTFEEKKEEPKSEKQTLGQRFQSKAIDDIHKEIKLNARLGIIKQLFKGDDTAFKGAINELNTAVNLSAAQSHLNQLKKAGEWDEENKWYVKLSELVERRFL